MDKKNILRFLKEKCYFFFHVLKMNVKRFFFFEKKKLFLERLEIEKNSFF